MEIVVPLQLSTRGIGNQNRLMPSDRHKTIANGGRRGGNISPFQPNTISINNSRIGNHTIPVHGQSAVVCNDSNTSVVCFVCILLTADGSRRARLPIPPTSNVAILLMPVITKDLPISPRFSRTIFLSRCKFSTLTTRQLMVDFYLLTLSETEARVKYLILSRMELSPDLRTTNTVVICEVIYCTTITSRFDNVSPCLAGCSE